MMATPSPPAAARNGVALVAVSLVGHVAGRCRDRPRLGAVKRAMKEDLARSGLECRRTTVARAACWKDLRVGEALAVRPWKRALRYSPLSLSDSSVT